MKLITDYMLTPQKNHTFPCNPSFPKGSPAALANLSRMVGDRIKFCERFRCALILYIRSRSAALGSGGRRRAAAMLQTAADSISLTHSHSRTCIFMMMTLSLS